MRAGPASFPAISYSHSSLSATPRAIGLTPATPSLARKRLTKLMVAGDTFTASPAPDVAAIMLEGQGVLTGAKNSIGQRDVPSR